MEALTEVTAVGLPTAAAAAAAATVAAAAAATATAAVAATEAASEAIMPALEEPIMPKKKRPTHGLTRGIVRPVSARPAPGETRACVFLNDSCDCQSSSRSRASQYQMQSR